ncbi:MAG: hypothetical protein LBN30_03015 [Oscillospiraceae bacterium]|jgi:hypothetical protein|nr:hypothetical protein [Oscillospiraceae bacterium]
MGLFPKVKCSRCDKLISKFSVRCPYCNATRGKGGKHSAESDNLRGKMVVGLSLIGIVVIAVVILLIASIKSDQQNNPGGSPPPSAAPSSVLPDDGSTVGVTPSPGDETPPPSEEPEPSPSDLPTATITGVDIKTPFSTVATLAKPGDFSEKLGKSLDMSVKVTPADSTEVPVWTSSDDKVFSVVPKGTDGLKATLTITGTGSATLTVTVGDKTTTCIVRGQKP